MGEVGAALERHPWNTSFEWQSPKGPYRSLTDPDPQFPVVRGGLPV